MIQSEPHDKSKLLGTSSIVYHVDDSGRLSMLDSARSSIPGRGRLLFAAVAMVFLALTFLGSLTGILPLWTSAKPQQFYFALSFAEPAALNPSTITLKPSSVPRGIVRPSHGARSKVWPLSAVTRTIVAPVQTTFPKRHLAPTETIGPYRDNSPEQFQGIPTEYEHWYDDETDLPQEAKHLEELSRLYSVSVDWTIVDKLWDTLEPKLKYLPVDKQESAKRALVFVESHSLEQLDVKSSRALEIAAMCADYRMDADAVIASFLIELFEAERLLPDTVENMFGHKVRRILDSVAVCDRAKTKTIDNIAEEQAENVRQLLFAMAEDREVLVVVLADFVWSMRRIEQLPPLQQQVLANQALEIFAPVADRSGLWNFKTECERIAFKVLHPEAFAMLDNQIRDRLPRYEQTLDAVRLWLQLKLQENARLTTEKVGVAIGGRIKNLYSIFLKLTQGGRSIEELNDIVASRVILDVPRKPEESDEEYEKRSAELCYLVLDLVREMPGGGMDAPVKDYIAEPKQNGYRSLHTLFQWEATATTVEIQIRTAEMHNVNEYGFSAHWVYEDSKKGWAEQKAYQHLWLPALERIQTQCNSSEQFVRLVKEELLSNRLLVILEGGTILNLNKGSTVLDAAFAINPLVGIRFSQALVNGKPVPMYHLPRNGDVVSIETEPTVEPTKAWLACVQSRVAHTAIKKHLQQKKELDNIRTEYRRQKLQRMGANDDALEALKKKYFEEVPPPPSP